MTNNFATAMRRATELTRAGAVLDPARLIQEALSGGAAKPSAPPPAAQPAISVRRFAIDRAAQNGAAEVNLWQIKGVGHGWSGGDGAGSCADPAWPDALVEILRLFLAAPEVRS